MTWQAFVEKILAVVFRFHNAQNTLLLVMLLETQKVKKRQNEKAKLFNN